jgi:hypothetical protein
MGNIESFTISSDYSSSSHKYFNPLIEGICFAGIGDCGSHSTSNTQTTNIDNSVKFGPMAAAPLPPACVVSCPGGGGSCSNEANTNSMQVAGSTGAGGNTGGAASANASAGGGLLGSASASGAAGASGGAGGGAGMQTSDTKAKNASSCPPNINQKSSVANISNSLMSVDQSTIIMNQSSLSSLSSSVNQMMVNSITSTTSSSTQNVNISQEMVININNVKGNVSVTNVSQNASVTATNSISMDLSAIDNVRTDLATNVLNQFAAASNTDSLNAAQASIEKEMAASNTTKNSLDQQNKVSQTQTAQLATNPIATVNYAVTGIPFDQINQQSISYINSRGGLDGLQIVASEFSDPTQPKYLIFAQQENYATVESNDGWNRFIDAYIGDDILTTTVVEGYDSEPFDDSVTIPGYLDKIQRSSVNQRGGIWQITVSNNIISLQFVKEVGVNQTVQITSGLTYGGATLIYTSKVLAPYTVPYYVVYKFIPSLVTKKTTFNAGTTKFFSYKDQYYAPGSQDKYIKLPQDGAFK